MPMLIAKATFMLPKVHNASLFRCSHCEVFFKSKKGYEGHLQNKHGPKVIGSDGKPKSRKEMQGLNKVCMYVVDKKSYGH